MRGINKRDTHALHFNQSHTLWSKRGICDEFEEDVDYYCIATPVPHAFLKAPQQGCSQLYFAFTSPVHHGLTHGTWSESLNEWFSSLLLKLLYGRTTQLNGNFWRASKNFLLLFFFFLRFSEKYFSESGKPRFTLQCRHLLAGWVRKLICQTSLLSGSLQFSAQREAFPDHVASPPHDSPSHPTFVPCNT